MTTSNARELAELATAYSAGALSGRNRIINGDMRVAQRGTSGTSTSSGYVSLDRWRAYISTNSTVTLSQQTFTPGQTDVLGDPEFFMRYDWLGTSPASTKIVMQRIENVKSLVGAVTLSFYAKTELGDNIDVAVYQNFGDGGSTEVTAIDQTIDVTDAWAKYTVTFTLPSLSGKTIGASSYIEVSFASRDTTANSYLDLADVQLEAGSVATPFERRQYGQELALCQRYTYRHSAEGDINNFAPLGMGRYFGTNNAQLYVPFKVTMRTNPTTVTQIGNIAVNDATFASYAITLALNESSSSGATVIGTTTSGTTAGTATTFYANDTASAALIFSAEL
jgi:hypothetical protein